jgi:Uma2 family endonuclease
MVTTMSRSATAADVGRKQHEETILALLPEPGQWGEQDYLWLTNHTNHLVELVDGHIEELPMPTERHQAILVYLFLAFRTLMQSSDGKVYFSPLRLRLRSGNFREPDLILLRSADDPRRQNDYWRGADLVLEVVSPDDPKRDHVDKRADYAQAGIPEYWIVDPQAATIKVLHLDGAHYAEHGVFGRGTTASSGLFADFSVNVDAVLDAD